MGCSNVNLWCSSMKWPVDRPGQFGLQGCRVTPADCQFLTLCRCPLSTAYTATAAAPPPPGTATQHLPLRSAIPTHGPAVEPNGGLGGFDLVYVACAIRMTATRSNLCTHAAVDITTCVWPVRSHRCYPALTPLGPPLPSIYRTPPHKYTYRGRVSRQSPHFVRITQFARVAHRIAVAGDMPPGPSAAGASGLTQLVTPAGAGRW